MAADAGQADSEWLANLQVRSASRTFISVPPLSAGRRSTRSRCGGHPGPLRLAAREPPAPAPPSGHAASPSGYAGAATLVGTSIATS